MKYKYSLPEEFYLKVIDMEEFANGATQVRILLQNGEIIKDVLISQCKYIIAIRGCSELPFKTDEIKDIFQHSDDIDPKERGGWNYWDDWKE